MLYPVKICRGCQVSRSGKGSQELTVHVFLFTYVCVCASMQMLRVKTTVSVFFFVNFFLSFRLQLFPPASSPSPANPLSL